MKHGKSLLLLFFVLMCVTSSAVASDVHPAAILNFAERGDEVAGEGRQITDLLFAFLVVEPDLYLVDRESLESTLEEQELSLTGVVRADEAVQVGQLTGAKILITGSVMQVGSSRFIIAKIMGTETSRVLGASVKGDKDEDLDILVQELAAQVSDTITERSDELVANVVEQEDRIALLAEELGEASRPSISVSIPEEHFGDVTIDPAAETEIMLYAGETDFPMIDGDSEERPDIMIVGEAFSEFAGRRGNLIFVKARVEVKAVERDTDRVLAVDRQTTVSVDLSEQIAAKNALQEAGARIAERLLPRLVESEE